MNRWQRILQWVNKIKSSKAIRYINDTLIFIGKVLVAKKVITLIFAYADKIIAILIFLLFFS